MPGKKIYLPGLTIGNQGGTRDNGPLRIGLCFTDFAIPANDLFQFAYSLFRSEKGARPSGRFLRPGHPVQKAVGADVHVRP
jgi:hypothetical protein